MYNWTYLFHRCILIFRNQVRYIMWNGCNFWCMYNNSTHSLTSPQSQDRIVILTPDLSCYWLKSYVTEEWRQTFRCTVVHMKSVNLQYITLGCLDYGTNESSTKSLIFQVLFFFILLLDLGHSKLFIFIFVIL